MAWVENLNNQEISTEIIWDPKEYSFEETKTALNGQENTQLEELIHDDSNQIVISHFLGKNINQIETNEILSMNPIKKAQLAREISSTKTDNKLFWHGFQYGDIQILPKDIKALNNFLEKWWTMNVTNLNNITNKTYNAEQRNQIFYVIGKLHLYATISEYKKMFNKWDLIPPMPRVSVLATWDLWGTTGIWWISNKWRLYFEYDLKLSDKIKNSTITRSINFGSLDTDAQIWISANWIDMIGEKWWWSFDISFWEKWVIHGDYGPTWLKIDDSNFPDGVKWENWILTIPVKYRNIPITITTKSAKYDDDSKWYDEVLFWFSCKNASIDRSSGIANLLYEVDWNFDLWLWKYELDSGMKNTFNTWLFKIMSEIDMSCAKEIPVNIWIYIDNTPFSNPEEFLNGESKKVGLESVVAEYDNNPVLAKKLKETYDLFASKIDVSSFGQNQQQAQKRLAECRFWESISIALRHPKFRSRFLSWRVKVNPEFHIGQRKIETYIKEEDLYYKKP